MRISQLSTLGNITRTHSTNRSHTMKSLILAAAVCFSPVLVASSAHAVLITPTGVTLNAGAEFFPISQVTDNSGLTAPFDLTVTHAASGGGNSWVSDGSGPDYFTAGVVPVMTFALNNLFSIDEANVWNYFQAGNGNQARDITIEFSAGGIGGVFGNATSITLAADTGASQTFTFAPVTANAIRFTVTDNYFGLLGGGGDRVGLAEVKFSGQSLIPEPSTMLLLGMGLVGLATRRRRRR